jgi:hypothetical protein
MNSHEKGKDAISIYRGIFLFVSLFGLFFAVGTILILEMITYSFFLGIFIFISTWYFRKRWKIFDSLTEGAIKLRWKSETTSIPIESVKRISKNYRFTFDDNFLWILVPKGSLFRRLGIYIFPNIVELDLKRKFEDIGITLGNMP